MLEKESVGLGDRVVAQMPKLSRQAGVDIRIVLGVSPFVKKGRVVLTPADSRDHQVDLLRHTDRRTVGPRRLGRALLEIENQVGLSFEIESEAGHGARERLDQPSGGIGPIEVGGAKEATKIAATRRRQRRSQ